MRHTSFADGKAMRRGDLRWLARVPVLPVLGLLLLW